MPTYFPARDALRWFSGDLHWFSGALRWFSGDLCRFSGALRRFPGELRQFSGELRRFLGDLRRFFGDLIRFLGDRDLWRFPCGLELQRFSRDRDLRWFFWCSLEDLDFLLWSSRDLEREWGLFFPWGLKKKSKKSLPQAFRLIAHTNNQNLNFTNLKHF